MNFYSVPLNTRVTLQSAYLVSYRKQSGYLFIRTAVRSPGDAFARNRLSLEAHVANLLLIVFVQNFEQFEFKLALILDLKLLSNFAQRAVFTTKRSSYRSIKVLQLQVPQLFPSARSIPMNASSPLYPPPIYRGGPPLLARLITWSGVIPVKRLPLSVCCLLPGHFCW